jgi:hypothetical protein
MIQKSSLPENLRSVSRVLTSDNGGRDDLIAIVLDNTLQIVQFFTDRVDHEPFVVLQHIEHEFLWLYRRTKEMSAGKGGSVIPEKPQAVVAAIESFRDHANRNDRFVKFKTLVGFESVFPLEWDNDAMDVEGAQRYRDAKIAEYAASVTAGNADEWFEVVELCAPVRSNPATFGGFLNLLARRRPNIALGYLTRDEETLSNFIPVILAGFAESDQPDIAASLVDSWIDQGRHLHAIARYLECATNTPEDLVIKVGKQAIRQKDSIAAIGIVAAIVERQLTSLVAPILLPSIEMLTDLKDARWIDGVAFLPSLRTLLGALSEGQSQVLLMNLILRLRVEHQDEHVLSAVAREYPELVLKFFRARIEHKENSGAENLYEAIPYHMADLGKVLGATRQAGSSDGTRLVFFRRQPVHVYGRKAIEEYLSRDHPTV